MTGGTTPSLSSSRPAARLVAPAIFVAVLLLASINLRAPFIAVAPLAGEIRADLGISAAEVGLLTSLPVLCFGLAAPLALLIARRTGPELALVTCLGGIVAGALVRSAGPFWLALAGTVVIGIAITVGNIVVPVIIRRDVRPARVGAVTGAYVAILNIGAMLASVATAPLSSWLGWRGALLAWAVLAVVGALAWMLFLRRRGTDHDRHEHAATAAPVVWRRPLAWLLALAFAGQSTSYYGLTAWLPSLLADERGLGPEAAGAAASLFQICAVIGAVGVPMLAGRLPVWAPILVLGALWVTMPVGLLLAPEHYLLFAAIGGVAQGGGFASLLTVIAAAAGSQRQAAALSAFVQGVGYTVAALAPPALGLAHDLTSAWTVPLFIMVGTAAAFGVFGMIAALRGAAARAR
ncbi:MFS transporter [Naasia sp. SYSU D00057]|uniref:MFS transporter n=1 Tax=Naasia sp. SYSU D00057 TaxID=2817380 RepID=UPI001B30E293|nr:MFS transporter [Naasia sp. SYSU D00057]